MKSLLDLSRGLFSFSLGAILLLPSCTRAEISGTLSGASESDTLFLKQSSELVTVDSVAVGKDGSFEFKVDVKGEERDFFYIYLSNRKLASLLLSPGEKVSVKCNRSGGAWSVEGSEECSNLLANELSLAELASRKPLLYRDFIEHYRNMVKYVYSHPHSLTTVPVFYQKVQGVGVFSQPYDGVIIGNIADSLSTVYPDSRYVSLLRELSGSKMDEARRLDLFKDASEVDYPEIELPDQAGQKRKLSESAGRKTLLVFWSVDDPSTKFFNKDILSPLYEKYASKGLAIYQVGVLSDIGPWRLAVCQQELPWTSVFDASASSAGMYGLKEVPGVFLIDGASVKKIEKLTLPFISAALGLD